MFGGSVAYKVWNPPPHPEEKDTEIISTNVDTEVNLWLKLNP